MVKVTLPGNKKVNAEVGGFKVYTDQPVNGGGDGTAPSPFEVFFASLGTCAGIYIVGFCQSRGLSYEGIELEVKPMYDYVNRKIGTIDLEITVPESFPKQYHSALVNSANLCAVKKLIEDPPVFNTFTTTK